MRRQRGREKERERERACKSTCVTGERESHLSKQERCRKVRKKEGEKIKEEKEVETVPALHRNYHQNAEKTSCHNFAGNLALLV